MTYARHDIAKLLHDRATNNDRDYSYFHASEIGACPRVLVLKKLGLAPLDTYDLTTLCRFDTGHSFHSRIQGYFRDAGLLMTEIVTSVAEGLSEVAFDDNDDAKKRIIVCGESGRQYPFFVGEKVWKKPFNPDKPWTRVEDLKVGDEWYLIEVPFESSELKLSGRVDGVILEAGKPTILEIKSSKDKSFWYLFLNDDTRHIYAKDLPRENECHICGKKIPFGSNLANHLVKEHHTMGAPMDKHIVQGNSYMFALGVESTLYWYESKDTHAVFDAIRYRDEELIEQIKDRCNKLWDIALTPMDRYKIPREFKTLPYKSPVIVDADNKMRIARVQEDHLEVLNLPKKPKKMSAHSCFDCFFCGYQHLCWPEEIKTVPIIRESLLREE